MGRAAVKVVPMGPADIPAAVALEQGSFTAWSPQHLEDELRQPAGFQFAARDGAAGELLGFVCGRLVANEAEILKLSVATEVRRQGIGTRLLEAALYRCREKGAAACFLELRASNTAAKRLYEKQGFIQFGKRKGYYVRPTEDAVMMRHNLGNRKADSQRSKPMKNIRDLDIKGKRLLIRVDFNVPLDEQGNITDDTRIRGVLPTLNHSLDERARLIICSHMGRPEGRRQEKFSLAPVAKRLSRLLDKEVRLAPDCVGPEVEAMVGAMEPGDVLLLENLRFHDAEKKNDQEFCSQLARLADIYINDAFAVAHRAHASVVGVVDHFGECAAGFLLQKEMDYFHRSVSNPSRPLAAIVGGAKVSSKLGALRNMIDRVDKLIIGGAMANTFLKAQGYEVGSSKVEDDLLETAGELIAKARSQGVKLYLPVDCIVADRFDAKAETKRTTTQEVPPTWMILDIGPATTMLFGEALEDARTIIWNGPMGAFEMDAFSRGTMAMVQRLTTSHALTIVGGGDTDVAIHRAGESSNISYISTGGGAFLMLLEGKVLPGVAALEGR